MYSIITAPDPLLRSVCEPCDMADESLPQLASEMARLMYKANGVGLAAPQVGVLKRIIVVDCNEEDYGKDPLVLINPEIVELKGDAVEGDEGCLSCPGISVPIARQPWARVRFTGLDGDEWEVASDGLLGRCLQHEIDHLNGKTLLETCDKSIRMNVLQNYELARAAGAKPGQMNIGDN